MRYILKDETSSIDLDEESTAKFQKFLDKMDEDEDVSNVFYNSKLFE